MDKILENKLRRIIRNEIKSVMNENLKAGKSYEVYEPGMGEWQDEMKYIGYDSNEKHHIFQSEKQMNSDFFMYVSKGDEKKEVR